jgi:hypothetical protein
MALPISANMLIAWATFTRDEALRIGEYRQVASVTMPGVTLI